VRVIARSPLDEERFGIVTARWNEATAADLDAALAYCAENRVELVIARCDAADVAAVHALEATGALLMDTLVYWARALEDLPDGRAGAPDVRVATAKDAPTVRHVAERAFHGYLGHYHMDPKLDSSRADEAYADWAYRSCTSRAVADEVLVGERDGAVRGFLTVRDNAPTETEIVLNGVLPETQGSGMYRHLLLVAMQRAKERGARRMLVSTQLTNYRVQHAWARAGFNLERGCHTFHLWRAVR
jgi:ribosomal protein S18 acetylase RimI-like enzyme